MKHLLVLTSLFALSACGGGFFDWYYYEKPEETALEETPTANPANTSVTQITTDLNNVDFRAYDGGTFSFTVDDNGVITGLSDGKEWHATREGDSNVFVDDNTGDRWDIDTYGDGDLRYSDFGIKHKEYDSDSYTVFAGGDSEQLRNVYTKSEIETIDKGGTVSTKYFYGTAVGVLKEKGEFVANARTGNAQLRVDGSTFLLNMPFDSGGDGKFWDVDVRGTYDYGKNKFINSEVYSYNGSSLLVDSFDPSSVSNETVYINAYGDTTATEAVGTVHLVGKAKKSGAEAVFDAAFGVSEK